MLRDQLGIGVVRETRDFRLVLGVSKENVWGGQRDDFDVNADAIHVFQAFRNVSHRRRHAKKTRAAILDDRLPRRALIEREFGGQVADLFEVDRRGRKCGGVRVVGTMVLSFCWFSDYLTKKHYLTTTE